MLLRVSTQVWVDVPVTRGSIVFAVLSEYSGRAAIAQCVEANDRRTAAMQVEQADVS